MNTEQQSTSLNPDAADAAPLSKEQELIFQNEVLRFIDEKIRPSLMMDGGDMNIVEFSPLTNGKYEILVQLMGACSSCPSSIMTLKMGVERLLTQQFDRIETITQV